MRMNVRNVLFVSLIGVVLLAASSTAGADGLTVGLLMNTERALDGYTLFSPMAEGNAYLIDNAGRPVHSWDIRTDGNTTPYLLDDGSVIRANGGFTQFAWDGSIVWDFDYTYQGHHDIEVLPNGNVLVLAYEPKTAAEAIAEGRDPDALNTGELVSEKIVEVRRTGLNSGEIVWEWHVWDHLVQDFDPAQANYDLVGDHPELIDINFGETSPNNDDSDWLHANAVDYNPKLDQIAISSRQFSELWIIDHSTTTGEAASHNGGRSGMGGDILYRWGNPRAYRAGGAEDQQLFVQHDAQWITPGLPGAGHLLIFNNGAGRLEGSFRSSVEEIVPPVDSSGGYPLTPGQAFGPAEPVWSYSDGDDFYSAIISGVGRLPNGNTLITSGVTGTIFEVTPDGETVWKYVNPIEGAGPLTQGDPIPVLTRGFNGNQVFRAIRYASDYPGLAGRNLPPGPPLELGVDSDDDGLLDHEESKIYDTEPLAADTDLDGLSDGDEVLTYRSDPLLADTDLDRLPDGSEVITYGSNPTLADTDGDGVSDGDEILIYGTDPLLPSLVGDVNCDGDVSSIDAALILQLTAGVVASLFCGEFADVNGDGNTTSIDAAIVLQFTAGLLDSLPT